MILAALLIATQVPAYTGPAKATVEVDGSTYRVFVRRGEVKVFNKSALSAIKGGRSVKRRDEMRRAVTQATGCALKDDFWGDRGLVGEIDCAPAE